MEQIKINQKESTEVIYSKVISLLISFFTFLSLLTLAFVILIGAINFYSDYPTIYKCALKSGIWDRQNSACGFLIIYGNQLESRKVLLD